MPNDYDVARAARKGPHIKMGQGMKRVEPENKSAAQDGSEKGAYPDRMKIKPKFGMSQDPPKLTDVERQKAMSSQLSGA